MAKSDTPWVVRDVPERTRRLVKSYAAHNGITMAQAIERLVDIALADGYRNAQLDAPQRESLGTGDVGTESPGETTGIPASLVSVSSVSASGNEEAATRIEAIVNFAQLFRRLLKDEISHGFLDDPISRRAIASSMNHAQDVPLQRSELDLALQIIEANFKAKPVEISNK